MTSSHTLYHMQSMSVKWTTGLFSLVHITNIKCEESNARVLAMSRLQWHSPCHITLRWQRICKWLLGKSVHTNSKQYVILRYPFQYHITRLTIRSWYLCIWILQKTLTRGKFVEKPATFQSDGETLDINRDTTMFVRSSDTMSQA